MRPLGSTVAAAYFAADDGCHGIELWRVQGRGDVLFADGFDECRFGNVWVGTQGGAVSSR